jgi:20S proteasome subunit alpha 5
MEPSSMDKIMEIDAHIGCAVSGLTADAQSMVEHGGGLHKYHPSSALLL